MLAFNVDGDQFSDQSLASWQIRIVKRTSRLCEVADDSSVVENVDVAIVRFDCIGQVDQKPLITALHGQGVCVVALKDDRLPTFELLDTEADAVVSQSADSSQIACTIWSAHRLFLTNRELNERLKQITEKMERRQRTDRAKAGLAERLHISESDALGRIRRLSRNARRPMSEICETLIAAQQIIDSARKLKPSTSEAVAQPATTPVVSAADRCAVAPSVEANDGHGDSPATPASQG